MPKRLGIWILLLCSHGSRVYSQFVDPSYIPDIITFPYQVHLVSCSLPASLADVVGPLDPSLYVCRYFCTSELSGPYVLAPSTGCVNEVVTALDGFQVPSIYLPSFKVLSPTTHVDESIRYKLTGGGRLFIADCKSLPCSSGSNLVPMGEIVVSIAYGIASQSHRCTTCSAKVPIGQVNQSGKSGAFSLFNGFSATSVDPSVPSNDDYTRPTGAIMNLVSYDGFSSSRPQTIFESTLTSLCQGLSASSASDLTASRFIQAQYLGKPQCADPVTGQSATLGCVRDKYLPFTGSNNNQALTISKAGNVVLCTCSVLTPALACAHPLYWIYSGMLTIAGPTGNQEWSIPVGTTFGLTISGFGLGTKFAGRDYIRIIPSTGRCSDANSIEGIKLGCPSCTSFSTSSTNIEGKALRTSDDPTIPKIVRIQVYATFTRLYFASPVGSYLTSGDRIAVLLGGIVVDGKTRAQWTAVDAQRAFQVSGRIRYTDTWDAACPSGITDCDDLVTGHVVTVEGGGTTVTIPAGMDEFESVVFSVVSGGADWELHSKLVIPETLQASSSVGTETYQICWGRRSDSSQSPVVYHSVAGRLSFYQPRSATAVTLSTATRIANVAQPMVISLTTNFLNNPKYLSLSTSAVVHLRVKFLNVAKLSFTDPVGTARSGRDVCGQLFDDLDSNDVGGFPQPDTCFVSGVITDMGVQTREVTLVFQPRKISSLKSICTLPSGARAPCIYRMSFSGMLGTTLSKDDSIVRLEVASPSQDDPYFTLESGTILSSFASTVGNTPGTTAAVSLQPETLTSAATSFVVNVASSLPTVSEVKIFFRPTLPWNISASTACTSDQQNSACSIESFGGGRNVISVKFNPPVPGNSMGVEVSFNSTWLPRSGTFSSNFFSEINSIFFVPVSNSLSVTTVAGESAGEGRILAAGLTGDGTRPFVGQRGEIIQAQFRLARTLRNSNFFIKLQLPVGYNCIPPINWLVGSSINECVYQLLDGEVWPANAWQELSFGVINPATPLGRTDPKNFYSIKIELNGNQVLSIPSFTSPSRAVITPLAYAAIQPTSFRTTVIQSVYVFVTVSHQLRAGSALQIFPPIGFSTDCPLIELLTNPPAYLPRAAGRPMYLNEGDLTCGGTAGQSFIAIRINRIIDANSLVGFVLKLTNPSTLLVESRGWNIFVVTPTGEPIEGSKNQVEYGTSRTRGARSWLLYPSAAEISISPPALSPASVTNMVISGISSPVSGVSLGRLIVQFPQPFSIQADMINLSSLAFSPAKIETAGVNRIEFVNISMAAGLQYAVPVLPVVIPESEPVNSAYLMYVEVRSFDGDPVSAAAVPLPPIRSVKNLMVDYMTRIVGQANIVTLRFQLTSSVPQGGTINIAMTGGAVVFHPNSVVLSFTSNIKLNSFATGSLSLGVLSPQGLAAGYHELKLNVVNSNIITDVVTWTVSTEPIDFRVSVVGPALASSLTLASLLQDTPLRNDRLGWTNRIVFRVRFPETTMVENLMISGPPGFVFADNCTSLITVTSLSVSDCRGTTFDLPDVRASAQVSFEASPPLQPATDVDITVSVRNPIVRGDPTVNFWSIIFTGTDNSVYASPPLDSFLLRDFEYFNVSLSSFAVSPTTSFPIVFAFSPKQSLPVTNTGRPQIRNDLLGQQFGVLNVTLNAGVRFSLPSGFMLDPASKDWNLLQDVYSREQFSIPKNDIYLNRTSPSELVLYMTGSKTLIADRNYIFVTNVFITSSPVTDKNEYFVITSLTPPDLTPVDESRYRIADVLASKSFASFQVTNLDSNYVPGATVNARIVVSGIDPPAAGNVIKVLPPRGFEILGPSEFPAVNVASLTIPLTVKNAIRMSSNVTELYWRAELKNQPVAASTLSWRVVGPLLAKPEIAVAPGYPRGSGKTSSLLLTMIAFSDANYVHLNISEPVGFNFSKSSSGTVTSACWNCIGLSGQDVRAGFSNSIRIDDVVLGKTGGDVVFSVKTFYVPPETSVTSPTSVHSLARDAEENVTGFFMSGSVEILTSTIQGSLPQPSYVSDVLNPRTTFLCRAELSGIHFSLNPINLRTSTGLFSQPMAVTLVISIDGPTSYTFPSSYFDFTLEPPFGTVESINTDNVQGKVTVEISSLMSQLRKITEKSYTISFPVIPQAGGDRAYWGIDMFVNGTLLNTNDKTAAVPSLARDVPVNTLAEQSVSLTVVSEIVSPNTKVSLEVVISGEMLPSGTRRVKLFAPQAFKFVKATITGDASATASLNTLLIASAADLSQINTPIVVSVEVVSAMLVSDSELPWIAVAYSSSTNIVAWRELAAVKVQPLEFVDFIYGGTSGLARAELVMDIYVRKSDSVASLEIFPPAGSVLRCSTTHVVKFINCTAPSNNIAGLTLNVTAATLPLGRYTVPLNIDLPITTPPYNFFDVVERNRLGVNVDGIFGVAGETIADSTILDVQSVSVSVIKGIATLSFSISTSTTFVDAIHLKFPPGYYHTITNPLTEVKSLNRKFPRKSAQEWLYTNSTDSLTFLVDDTKANIINPVTGRLIDLNKIIGGETYSFTFPISPSKSVPVIGNYWILSFCQSRYDLESCSSGNAIGRFPVFLDS